MISPWNPMKSPFSIHFPSHRPGAVPAGWTWVSTCWKSWRSGPTWGHPSIPWRWMKCKTWRRCLDLVAFFDDRGMAKVTNWIYNYIWYFNIYIIIYIRIRNMIYSYYTYIHMVNCRCIGIRGHKDVHISECVCSVEHRHVIVILKMNVVQ